MGDKRKQKWPTHSIPPKSIQNGKQVFIKEYKQDLTLDFPLYYVVFLNYSHTGKPDKPHRDMNIQYTFTV